MSSNFLASSGNCELMSPPRNMLSRYIHFLCTSSHTYTRNMFSAGTLWTSSSVMGDLDTLSDLYGLTDQGQVFLPLLYGTKERSNKTTACHALQVHGIIVQIKHNLIHCANHRATFPGAFNIRQHTERHVSPGLHHLLYSLEAHTDMFDELIQLIPRSSLRWFRIEAYLLNAELFHSRRDNITYDICIFVQLHSKHVLQSEGVSVHLKVRAGPFHQFLPVSAPKNTKQVFILSV